MPNIRDRLANVPIPETARACFAIIDRIQHEPDPAIQLAAMLCAGQLVIDHIHDHHDISPSDSRTYIRNLMNHAEGRRHEFAAADAYLTKEIINRL